MNAVSKDDNARQSRTGRSECVGYPRFMKTGFNCFTQRTIHAFKEGVFARGHVVETCMRGIELRRLGVSQGSKESTDGLSGDEPQSPVIANVSLLPCQTAIIRVRLHWSRFQFNIDTVVERGLEYQTSLIGTCINTSHPKKIPPTLIR